jgi:hypothetical protein
MTGVYSRPTWLVGDWFMTMLQPAFAAEIDHFTGS